MTVISRPSFRLVGWTKCAGSNPVRQSICARRPASGDASLLMRRQCATQIGSVVLLKSYEAACAPLVTVIFPEFHTDCMCGLL
jgi:hypothetical protein